MDNKQNENYKVKRIVFLVFGIITFIISFLIPFLWVISAMLFFLAYETNKEYKKQREAEKKRGTDSDT